MEMDFEGIGAPQKELSVFIVAPSPGAARFGSFDELAAELEGARLLWRVATFAVDEPPPVCSAGVLAATFGAPFADAVAAAAASAASTSSTASASSIALTASIAFASSAASAAASAASAAAVRGERRRPVAAALARGCAASGEVAAPPEEAPPEEAPAAAAVTGGATAGVATGGATMGGSRPVPCASAVISAVSRASLRRRVRDAPEPDADATAGEEACGGAGVGAGNDPFAGPAAVAGDDDDAPGVSARARGADLCGGGEASGFGVAWPADEGSRGMAA